MTLSQAAIYGESTEDGFTELRAIVLAHGRIADPSVQIGADDDLFAKGLDSLGIVNVMLAVEEAFDVELPDSMLNRRTFASLRALRHAIASLQGDR